MKHHLHPTLLLFAIALMALAGCEPEAPDSSSPGLLQYFADTTLTDTVHLAPDPSEGDSARKPGLGLLYSTLDSGLLSRMDFYPDSAGTEAFTHWASPLGEQTKACLLETQQHWFVFKYLLLYDEEKKKFNALIPVAQWYGGEGGQIRTESWLFDWNNEKPPKLLTRFSEHSLRLTEEGEAQDLYEDSVNLRAWEDGQFRNISLPDSSRWIEQYPVVW